MKFYFLIAVLLFSGCATPSPVSQIQATPNVINAPSPSQEQQAELGDTLISKDIFYMFDGMKLLNDVHSTHTSLYGASITIPAGELTAESQDAHWIYFYSKEATRPGIVGPSPYAAGLRMSKKKKNMEIFIILGYVAYTRGKPEPMPRYELQKVRANDKSKFRQELIYNGRTGSNIKFMYRESSNDLMRPAFSQEAQYDLNDSKTIGFKGARIEIIEATNTHLKYKVLSSFPDEA